MGTIEQYVDETRQDRFKLIRDTLLAIIDRDDGFASISELMEAFDKPKVLSEEEKEQLKHEVLKSYIQILGFTLLKHSIDFDRAVVLSIQDLNLS